MMKVRHIIAISIVALASCILLTDCSHPRSPIHGVWVVDSLMIDKKDYSLLLYSNMVIYEDDGTFVCSTNRIVETDEDTGNYQLLNHDSLLVITINNSFYNDTYSLEVLEKDDLGRISSIILKSKMKKIYLQKLP